VGALYLSLLAWLSVKILEELSPDSLVFALVSARLGHRYVVNLLTFTALPSHIEMSHSIPVSVGF